MVAETMKATVTMKRINTAIHSRDRLITEAISHT